MWKRENMRISVTFFFLVLKIEYSYERARQVFYYWAISPVYYIFKWRYVIILYVHVCMCVCCILGGTKALVSTWLLSPKFYVTIFNYLRIMDITFLSGESIPIRLFLAGYDPTPTMRDVNKKFSVRYFLNLVLVDEEDRRYFKQQVGLQFWGRSDNI